MCLGKKQESCLCILCVYKGYKIEAWDGLGYIYNMDVNERTKIWRCARWCGRAMFS